VCPVRGYRGAGRKERPKKKAIENIDDAIREYLSVVDDLVRDAEIREIEVSV
jgi:hypothetical protein